MKNIKYIILGTFILTLLFVGCDSEQAGQDVEPVRSTDNYPVATFALSGGELSVNEADETIITYNITLDHPIDRPIDFSFVATGGTATLHDDYDFVNGTVPAYDTSGQMSIVIYNDLTPETTETLYGPPPEPSVSFT